MFVHFENEKQTREVVSHMRHLVEKNQHLPFPTKITVHEPIVDDGSFFDGCIMIEVTREYKNGPRTEREVIIAPNGDLLYSH